MANLFKGLGHRINLNVKKYMVCRRFNDIYEKHVAASLFKFCNPRLIIVDQ